MLNMTFPFLFVAPNAVRAVSTRCGVGMMAAVPAGDHRANLSVAGAPPAERCRSGGIDFAAVPLIDDQDRYLFGQLEHFLGNASQEKVSNAAHPVLSDHDQVVALGCLLDDIPGDAFALGLRL